MKRILYIFLSVLMLSACAGDRRADILFERVESIMEDAPDSALAILDSAESEMRDYSKADRMRYQLLKAEAMNKAFMDMASLQDMSDVLDFYMHHGSKGDKVKANYLMGCIYRDRGNSPEALRYMKDALHEADTLGDDVNYKQISIIYSQIAFLFNQQRFPQHEIPMLKKASKYALLSGDTLHSILYEERISGAYYMMGKLDSSFIISKKSYEAFTKIGEVNCAASSLAPIIAYYLKRDSINPAKKAIDEYLSEMSYETEDGDMVLRYPYFYNYLGIYYDKTGKLDSAMIAFRRLLSSSDDYNYKENGYRGLLSVFSQKNEPDSVFKYARLYADANDSANILFSANEISRANMLYDYSESQELALMKSEEANRLWRVIYIIPVFVILILFFIYSYVKRQRIKRNKEFSEANRLYFDTLAKYKKVYDENRLLESSISKYRIEKEKELEALRVSLSQYQKSLDTGQWDIEHSLLDDELVKRLHEYTYRLVEPSETEWDALEIVVKRLLPDFYDSIINGNATLNAQEKKVCLLTKLHFIPSEVATLLGVTKQRVTNLRSNINEKMFGEKGSKSFDGNILSL